MTSQKRDECLKWIAAIASVASAMAAEIDQSETATVDYQMLRDRLTAMLLYQKTLQDLVRDCYNESRFVGGDPRFGFPEIDGSQR